MTKKFILLFTLKLCSLAVFFLFTWSCSAKESKDSGSWAVNLLGLVSHFPEDKGISDPATSVSEESYTIRSVSPTVVFENSNFSIEGENLSVLTRERLFGEGSGKFLEFTEMTDTKITVSLFRCPDISLVLLPSDKKENNQSLSIPCLGSFRYLVRSMQLELGLSLVPISPIFLGNSLEILRSLGEVEFVSLSPLPAGIHLNPDTGEIKGTPTETTGNEFQSYTVFVRLKTDPEKKITSSFQLIVVSEEEKNNRTCKSISQTSTCRGPAPHVCSNSSVCYTSQSACVMDSRCGF
ncbi:putative Ig domain-containing protein [Leptospira sp. 201903075]|uniref:Ig domain-containing protein n=1 Tax=Leptospira chreensis TaxID=2810035 RepID=UPI001965F83E|nr:Ig domain-containing protein [Leptospira chreensis]MBM9592250.1 putative Ig domain-containing protein [Leptospira chreensis]